MITKNYTIDQELQDEMDRQAHEAHKNRSEYIRHMVRGRMKLPKDNKEN